MRDLGASAIAKLGVNIPFQWVPAVLGYLPAEGEVTGTVRVPDAGWPRVQQAISSWVDRFNVSQGDFVVDKPNAIYSATVPGGTVVKWVVHSWYTSNF